MAIKPQTATYYRLVHKRAESLVMVVAFIVTILSDIPKIHPTFLDWHRLGRDC